LATCRRKQGLIPISYIQRLCWLPITSHSAIDCMKTASQHYYSFLALTSYTSIEASTGDQHLELMLQMILAG